MDQSGFYFLPCVVRTYAPVGQTPVLREKLSRDHLSVISGISLEGKLFMMEQKRACKGEDVVRFLKHPEYWQGSGPLGLWHPEPNNKLPITHRAGTLA